MKNYLSKILVVFLLIGVISCQSEDETVTDEETLIENKIEELSVGKSTADVRLVCSIEGIPDGYRVEEYFNIGRCPNFNLFLGRFNAAFVSRINTVPNKKPVIQRAGPGCADNYCIWIVGKDFEDNAYVDIRKATGNAIISTYRGSDRTFTTNAAGQNIITLRLKTQAEKDEFARRGLRIWVVNPAARKWSNSKFVKRPGGGPIDPPCNPICP